MSSPDLEQQIANLSPAKRALLAKKRRQSTADPILRRGEHRDGAPLSYTQQSIWLIHQLDPQSYLYNVPRALRLIGKLDPAALEASLNEIIRRHDALRTTFRAESGNPLQVIAPELRIALPVSDAPSQAAALNLALEEYRRPFDLTTGPLLRARLWRLGEREHLLLLVMHHIISDGWSGGVFFDELGILYEAFSTGTPSPLPELPIQYADFAVWQRAWLERALDRQLSYWRSQLTGALPALELPTDHPRPKATSFYGNLGALRLAPELAQRVIAFAQTQGVTLFPIMLAALRILLYRWTGQTDLVIGTVSANRNAAELEKLIGCFINFLALREHVQGSEQVQRLIEKEKKTVLEAYAHQDCPFEKVVEAVNPERVSNMNPLYNVSLLVQNYPAFAFRGSQLEASFLSLDTQVAFLDIRFIATETVGSILLECECNRDLFDRPTVDLLLTGYRDVLEQMVEQPNQTLDAIRIPDSLARQAQAHSGDRQQSIAIAATFTAELIERPLKFWMRRLGVPAKIQFAPFNQVFQQLLDPSSLLASNQQGFNLVLLRLEDLVPSEDSSQPKLKHRLSASVNELVNSLQVAARRSSVPNVLCLCPPSATVRSNAKSAEAYHQAEASLVSRLEPETGISVITPSQLLSLYSVANYDDEYAWQLGRIPYTPPLFTVLATMIARRLWRRRSTPHQVILVDCDQTLWRGGPAGVEVDPPRRMLQEFLVAQQRAGMILCVCGQQSRESAEKVFETQPGMRLKWQHVAEACFNERPSAKTITRLAEELGLDPASFIFVSASPSECAEIRANCPTVTVAELPADAEQIPHFLSHFWAFDPPPAGTCLKQTARCDSAQLSEIANQLSTVDAISEAIASEKVTHVSGGGEYAPPRTGVEELLADVWAQLLRVERVGIRDNFFSLGGHSLLALQVIARIRKMLGVEMPLRAMFDAPTIAEFAERVEAVRRAGDQPVLPLLQPVRRERPLPLSYAQQRMWFINQLEPGSPLYNISAMYRMWGKLHIEALEKTINEIVRRHESLRTTFPSADGNPVQLIAPQLQLPLPLTVCTGLSEEEREAEIRRFAREQTLQGFDLSAGPLLRFSLLKLAEEEHVLVVILHHIVGDGWSGSLLAREMATLYEAFAQNRPSPLPELTIQYADFAVWQRQWMQGELLDRQLAYWKRQLAGAPPVLELPTDRPRPAVQSHRGAVRTQLIPRKLLDRVRALSQSEGATLFMTLLAAFQLLLARYSGQEDIVVGSTIAGRNYSEIEPLIGFFVNTLALRTDLSQDPSFRGLLARVKQVALDAYAHQEIPFEKLVEELQPERSLSYNPIFQVLFGLQNLPKTAFEASGLKVERAPLHPGTSIFDMSWFAFETSEGLLLRVEYDTDLFEDASIGRALGHFERLLEGIVANPEHRISELPLITPEEQHRILVEFNDTAAESIPGFCIHHFLEQQAERAPAQTALVCGQDKMSYGELNERANQIAHYLMKLGAGPEVLVGVFMERTADLVPSIFGILKSGAAYVPLDPSYPNERLSSILDDARAPIVLTQQSLCGQLDNKNVTFVSLDSEWEKVAQESRKNPVTTVKPNNLAYVLFTSGSTGRPKGVALEHHSNVTFVRWALTVFNPEELRGVLFCTSIGFDMSTFEMFITAAAGGKIILAENALYLPTLPARDEITLINTVPSAIAELVRMNALPESLETVALAGEALPASLVEEIYRTGTVKKVYNLYGPTESGYSTWTLVPRDARVTIGRPIANEQCYILDQNLNPVPIGVPGELYLTGEGLARGYYGRPELTQERFVANPFGTEANARMYKTGDLCRWLADGDIDYLGRIDHQVKLRGFRIELGEIEAVLLRHSGVRQCLVVAREDQPGLKRLVAYFVPPVGVKPDPDSLTVHLRQSLPDFMVPSAFVALETFPLTANGKIDRKALPAPDYKQDVGERYVAPRNEFEQKVGAIWAEVLHLDRVGAEDDFFVLGGHSLLAAQVISRIRQNFRIEIPLRTIFESPSLAGLAEQVDTAVGTTHRLELPPLQRISRDEVLPLSAAQQSLWFLDQLDPNSPAYNIPSTHRLSSALDLHVLKRSVDALVARHETLRTTYVAVQGQPVQVIAPFVSVPVDVKDFSYLPQPESEQRALEWVLEAVRRPFNLAQGPLLRVTVAQLVGGAQLLSLCIHHIISDRWSSGLLLRDLSELYTAEIEGKQAALPTLPVQYADFAAWQRNMSGGESFRKQIAYWMAELKDVPPVLELPTDRPRPAMESFAGDVAPVTLSKELTDRLHELSRAHGTTLFMTLLAAFQALMGRYSGQDDVVLGIPIASRRYPEIENLIGLFASTLPLRAKLQGDPTFAEILAQAKTGLLNADRNQDVPFEKIVEELQPERSLSHSPLAQVYFILQNAPYEGVRFKDMEHVPTYTGTSKGDLFFSLREQAGGLTGVMEYKTELFDRSTIERLLGHFRMVLEAVVVNPDLRLSQLPLLTEEERRLMLVEWNATDSDYPRHLCLHELFEQQVEQTPEAVACVFENETLTYRELNQRANQLAEFLRRQGAGPGQRIGIFVERSLEMMVGLLGIQKSGSAYVPIDPGYPAARIALLLEDAAVPVLLTQQALVASVPPLKAQLVCLDKDWPSIREQSSANVPSGATPEDLVYVIYTSGSTGKPKGVQVPHRAVVNLLTAMAKQLGMGTDDVFPALASFAFDMSIPELYLALVTGGCVAIGRRHLAGDGEELARFLRDHRATIVHATPTTWGLLLEAGFTGAGLKRVIGAEALPPELCARLLQAENSLFNFYGPTETTVWSTFHHFQQVDEPVVVGRPLANTQVYILDGNLQPAPIGIAKEIYIAGDGVTCGYYNRPELTAEKFLLDPFTKKLGGKMYRTGDLGRHLADGRIECLGRGDQQVKVRGYRIELGEIEAVLAKHPAVQECVVLAREDVVGDKRLVGYVVPVPGQTISAPECRTFVKERLPDYMVPVAVVAMEKFPLTPNGKVNRKALPAPEYQRADSDTRFLAPRTPAEEIIAAIWSEVLRLDRVGVEDNFFELGGHSLAGTQVVSRIREALQVDLPLRVLFEAPTVSAQADRVTRLKRQDPTVSLAPLVRAARSGKAPLSFAQQRLWFLDQLEPLNPLYNVPYIVRFEGPLQAAVLEASLNEIVRRHESLRTRFEDSDGEPVQVVEAWQKLPLTILDVSSLPADARLAEARRLAMEEVKRPFHLGTAPPVRALLIKLSNKDHALVLNTHHIITDRWSWGVLSQELAVLYEAFLEGKPSPLEELPLQYSDYAIWQRKQMTESWMSSQVAYWKKHLEGAPAVLELPTARPRRAMENFWGGIRNWALPEDLGNDLRALSRRLAVTPFMTFLATFQLLLARLSGQDDIMVGTDLANRTQLATEKLIGFFVNLLPIRTRMTGDPTFTELLGRVKEVSLGAFAHQDVPFEKLVEELRPERNLTHHPLVQMLFVLQNTPRGPREFGGLKSGPLGVSSTSRFDLVLFINNPDGIPLTTWMYNPNLFDDSSIARMAELYETILRTIIAEPEARLSRIYHLLEEVERQRGQAEQRSFQETSLRKLRGARRKAALASVDQDTESNR